MGKKLTKNNATKSSQNMISRMYDYGSVYTGDFKESPAYKKVQADKARANANLAAYKKKVSAQKAAAVKKAQAAKKK